MRASNRILRTASLVEIKDALRMKDGRQFVYHTIFEKRTFETGTGRVSSWRLFRLPFFVLDAFVTCAATIIQVMFPLVMLVGCLFVVPICY